MSTRLRQGVAVAPDVDTQTTEIAAGAQIVVRDEEWLVRSVRRTERDGMRIEASGISELVRDQDAVFFDSLDEIVMLDPHNTELVADTSSAFRGSRLWIESLLRQSATPITDTEIVSGHRGLADAMGYQLRPAHQALSNLRPRILIGDAVGLGKTLEIGITLTELIERGRGERILVVTPRAVLEQFQREMWTRYAIPLVRLDSDGIQQVRQTLPASRNPFSYYRRAIVSIDTLKNPARYRHHLAGQHWDAVVIDECHNLINRGTQNNELARLLARQTDALILASATPHNGKPESFAELIDLLDPTAIADPGDYRAEDIAHLYVRRHRNSPDVRDEVGHRWAARQEPRVVPVTPTPPEQAVLEELRDVWLHPASGTPPVSGRGRGLFPWTLFKAFLSSPEALRASIERRLATLGERGTGSGADSDGGADSGADSDDSGGGVDDAGDGGERAQETRALTRLDELAAVAQDAGPAKLEALVQHLREIGVHRRRDATRVVVFSERIQTLDWLREQLRSRLKLPEKAVAMLHAQLPDRSVQEIRTDFELSTSPVRVLLASDMASEGINLHRQCHQLVHYDLPWSFIRIQQRNGRIDRYQQEQSPQITALALTVDDPATDSDLRVVTKLLAKEHAAHQALGDAGALLNLHDEQVEEDAVLRFLRDGQDLDEVVPEPEPEELNPFAALMATGGEHAEEPPVPTAPRRTLFDNDDTFLTEALAELGTESLDLQRDEAKGMVAFDTPEDLAVRLADLPGSYLSAREVTARIRLSAQTHFAEQRLTEAHQDGGRLWPDVSYLAPIHPVLEWATSRALARFGRNQAPVMAAEVAEPVFLTQATWANTLGQPVVTHWGAITGLPDDPEVAELRDAVEDAGLKEHARNPGGVQPWVERLQPLVPAAVQAATADLHTRRQRVEDALLARLEEHRSRLDDWEQQALIALEARNPSGDRKDQVRSTRDTTAELIDALSTAGDPFVRVIGLIVPRDQSA